MNKEGMIKEIYEKVANKEKSFGCRLIDSEGCDMIYIETDRSYPVWRLDGPTDKFKPGLPLHFGYATDWLEKNIKYKDYETFEQLGGKVSVDVKHGKVSFIVGSTVFSSLRMQNKVGNEATVFFHKQNIDNKWKDKTQPIEHPENIQALTYIYNLIKNEGT